MSDSGLLAILPTLAASQTTGIQRRAAMNRIQRCLAALAGLGATLIVRAAAAPAAFAYPAKRRKPRRDQPATPPPQMSAFLARAGLLIDALPAKSPYFVPIIIDESHRFPDTAH